MAKQKDDSNPTPKDDGPRIQGESPRAEFLDHTPVDGTRLDEDHRDTLDDAEVTLAFNSSDYLRNADFDDAMLGDGLDAFRIIKPLGRGGMGEVFLAEQLRPVRRQVALKIIREINRSKTMRARFEVESRALGLMHHPNIAQVYDVGTGRDGQAFFVMEYVDGQTITRFCDENSYSINQRLQLFVDVCAAVHHAHQKGVIHRDLKPANVLIDRRGERPTVKVIDFGIAKALVGSLSDGVNITREGACIGTPAYMSPEQLQNRGDQVDIRSDVFALGMLLYEMLTGGLPHRRKGRGEVEMMLEIIQGNTPKPSQYLLEADELTRLAEHRNMAAGQYLATVRGELDWIVMKAIDAEPDRRYGSASELAADVKHYLHHEPVAAGPPSRRYRFTKFVRRHRTGVFIAGAAMFLVLLASISTAIGFRKAVKMEALAENARAQMAVERDLKIAEAERAQAVQAFLEKVLTAPDPRFQGPDVRVVDVLDRAGARLEDDFEGQSSVRVTLLALVGRTYLALDQLDKAEPYVKQAREEGATIFEENSRESLEIEFLEAQLIAESDRAAEAESFLKQLFARCKASLGETDPHTLRVGAYLGTVLYERSKLDEARDLLEPLTNVAAQAHGPDDEVSLEILHTLAATALVDGRLDDALLLYEREIAAREGYSEDDPYMLQARSDLALTYYYKGEYEKSAEIQKALVPLHRKVFGERHRLTGIVLSNFAMSLSRLGKESEAEATFKEALAMERRDQGEQTRDYWVRLNNLAAHYKRFDQLEKAADIYRQVVAGQKSLMGPDHMDTIVASGNLAATYMRLERFDEAETLYLDVVDRLERHFGFDHRRTVIFYNNAAMNYKLWGRPEKALLFYEKAYKRATEGLGPDSKESFLFRGRYGTTLATLKRYEEAEPFLLAAQQGLQKLLGDDHRYSRNARLELTKMYDDWGHPEKADPFREISAETEQE